MPTKKQRSGGIRHRFIAAGTHVLVGRIRFAVWMRADGCGGHRESARQEGRLRGARLARLQPAQARPLDRPRPLPHRHDRARRHGHAERRLDRPRKASTPTTSAAPSITSSAKAARTASSAIRSATTATPTATASRCCSSRKCSATRKTKTAAPSWSMCSLAPCNSPARPKRRPAAGATSARKTAAASTKARPRSRKCKACAAAATPASPCRRKSSTRPCKYIKNCTLPEGGVQYSSKGGGGRPAITAAAIACLFNAGQYDDDFVPRMMKYCEQNLSSDNRSSYGHWHYAHFYYSQVQYREGGEQWERLPQRSRSQTAPRGHRSENRRQNRRRMDARLHRPHLHDRPQPDHPPTRQRLPADLSDDSSVEVR